MKRPHQPPGAAGAAKRNRNAKAQSSKASIASQSPAAQGKLTHDEKLEAQIRGVWDEDLSSIKDRLVAEYFQDPSTACARLEKDLRQRLMMLFLLATSTKSASKKLAEENCNIKSDAIEAICSTARFANFCIQQIANAGSTSAAECLWDNCVNLVSAINLLAEGHPALLKARARKSLYMPSFRAKVPKFTNNFHQLSENVELAKDVSIKTGDRALYGLDSLATQFVAKLLKEASEKRELLIQTNSVLDAIHAPGHSLSEKKRLELLLNLPGIKREHLGYLSLPEYNKSTAKEWWARCIKPTLENPETLRQLEGTKFYDMLVKGAKLPVDYEIREQLKKLCIRPVLNSLAP